MNSIHTKTDQLDLNLLKVFETVYREQHLSRAAQSLSLTPSAVSHAIRRLREQLADPLFVRDGRRMSPTPSCQRMAPALLDHLTKLRQLLQQWGQFDPLRTQQTFRIGMPDAIEVMLLPAVVQGLSQQAPHAVLASSASDRKEITRALASGYLDLVIDVALPISEPVRHRPLLQDAFCIVARAGHPSRRRPTLAQYLQAQHVAVSTRASGSVIEDTALLNLGLQRNIAVRCQNYHSACKLVEQSDYLLTMPARVARPICTTLALRQWALPFELPPIQLHMYWHVNSEFDPANQWLRQLMMAIEVKQGFG
ncbi:LysR family transcriptional regulator [Dyella silvatica]|uniref:LysR family transcriptional regulator n=1 Tax=Dyella silvatica TaxID=2992128 RepID=UPI00225A9510|nr:LysR family transcriptional regulator [Dyella silvatica]